ncbi:MAG: metallophosphoesterase [Bacteroidota bacterium]
MKKRILILCLISIVNTLLFAQTKTADNEFSFVILGDSQFHSPEEFNEIVEEVALMNPSLVIQVGDLIHGRTEDAGELAAQWHRFKGQLSPLMNHEIAYFPVPGNHDVEVRNGDNTPMVEAYQKEWGKDLYYSFDYKNAHFTVLNSIDPEGYQISEQQLAWLEKDLEAAKEQDHRLVFCHHPMYEFDNFDVIHTILLKHQVTAVFYGHRHHFESMVRDGIPYVMTNATGRGIRIEEAGSFQHFLHATVRDDDFSFCIVKEKSVLSPAAFAPEDNRLYHLNRYLFPQNIVSPDTLARTDSGYVFTLRLNNPTFQDVRAYVQWESPNRRWKIYPQSAAQVDMEAESTNNSLNFEFVRTDQSIIEVWPKCIVSIKFLTSNGSWVDTEYELKIEEP